MRLYSDTLSLLDIGSSKVVCAIVDMRQAVPRVLGLGYQASSGMRHGVMTDMERLKQAVSRAIYQAEEQARSTIRHVWVGLSGESVRTQRARAEITLAHRPIGPSEVSSVVAQTERFVPEGYALVHHLPLSFKVDETKNLTDPIGLYGHSLQLHAFNVCAHTAHLKNLRTCLNRSHVEVQGFLLGPYMGALCSLTEEERQVGCVFVDMGATFTTVCVMHGGQMVAYQGMPLGAHHITQDLAQAFSLPLVQAERLKVLCGLIPSFSWGSSSFYEGEDELLSHMKASTFQTVVEARVHEILDAIASMVQSSGLNPYIGQRVILSGGGAQLKGLKDKAQSYWGRPVRISETLPVSDLKAHPNACGLMPLAGMMMHLQEQARQARTAHEEGNRSVVGKMMNWIRENI